MESNISPCSPQSQLRKRTSNHDQQQNSNSSRRRLHTKHSRHQSHDPSDLRQGSWALASSNTGSPRFTDFPSNLANLIGWEYETNALHMLRKPGPARALDLCRRSEGSWLWGRECIQKWRWLTVSLGIKLENKSFQLFPCVYYFGIFARFYLVEI